jgi:PDZ domain-containing protein
MEEVEPGQEVQLVVDRGDTRKDITVGTRANPEDPKQAVFGVQIEQSADIELPVAVKIEAGNIGGPSAGLAFALDIVDELGRDLDRGKTVVATGAIRLDGQVDPIGGIQQKTIGARQAGADLFLVPDANAAEARRYADGLPIVAVSNFKEALSNLATNA